MAKIDLSDVVSGYASATKQNANNASVEDHLNNKVLYRDNPTGEANSMQQELDMNSNDITNARTVSVASLTIGGVGVVPGTDTVTVPTASSIPNVAAGDIVATDVQAAIDELDSEKVSVAGAETVTGDKTFSGSTELSGTTILSGQTTISGNLTTSGSVIVTKNLTQKLGSTAAVASMILDDGNIFNISGTASISTIASKGVGTVIRLHFDSTPTLIYHATNLILPGGINILAAAGDEAEFVEYASGQWRCTSYQRASKPTTFRGALVFSSIDLVIPNATYTNILFNSELYDTGDIHSTVSNTDRLIVPAGVTKIRLSGKLVIASSSTGTRRLSFGKNGSTVVDIIGLPSHFIYNPDGSTSSVMFINSAVIPVVAGDYLTMHIYQTSGAGLTAVESGVFGQTGSNIWLSMEIVD